MDEWSLKPGYLMREVPDVCIADVPGQAVYREPSLEEIRRIIRPTTAIVSLTLHSIK
jgi:hypothetical protein